MVALDCIIKQVEEARGARQWAAFFHDSCFRSCLWFCPGFPSCWIVTGTGRYKPNKHYTPQVGLGLCFIIATESQVRTKASRLPPNHSVVLTVVSFTWVSGTSNMMAGKCVNSGRAGPRRACLTVVTHGPHPLQPIITFKAEKPGQGWDVTQ